MDSGDEIWAPASPSSAVLISMVPTTVSLKEHAVNRLCARGVLLIGSRLAGREEGGRPRAPAPLRQCQLDYRARMILPAVESPPCSNRQK